MACKLSDADVSCGTSTTQWSVSKSHSNPSHPVPALSRCTVCCRTPCPACPPPTCFIPCLNPSPRPAIPSTSAPRCTACSTLPLVALRCQAPKRPHCVLSRPATGPPSHFPPLAALNCSPSHGNGKSPRSILPIAPGRGPVWSELHTAPCSPALVQRSFKHRKLGGGVSRIGSARSACQNLLARIMVTAQGDRVWRSLLRGHGRGAFCFVVHCSVLQPCSTQFQTSSSNCRRYPYACGA